MLTEAQVAERQNYIGGGDAAAVLGLSRWKTPLEVWGEKVGIIKPEDISDKLHIWLGNELEDVVSRRFTLETGKAVRRVNDAIRSKDYPFLGANIDRSVVGEDAILEAKTASGWKAKEWAGEEIPQEYIIQCYHYLLVTGKRKAYIAVLIGNQDFVWKEVLWDEAIINQMKGRLVSFWKDFVEPKRPPEVRAADTETLSKIYPTGFARSVELHDDVAKLIEARNALIQDVKSLESQIELHENEIKAQLKDNEAGTVGKWLVTWKNVSTTRLDQARIKTEAPEIYNRFSASSEYRRFTIREIKQK